MKTRKRLLARMHRVTKLLGSLSISPKKEYDTSKSTLLKELVNLRRPLVLCYENKTRPHFVLDLDERIFCHATLPTTSDTFFVDYDQTDNDTVVFTGSTLDGNAPWEVKITRKERSRNPKKYLADVVVDKDNYYRRVIRGK